MGWKSERVLVLSCQVQESNSRGERKTKEGYLKQKRTACIACIHAKLSLTLCNPMDCCPPGSSVQGILQARILEWVAMPSSKWSSWPRDQTHFSYLLHLQAGSLSACANPPKSKAICYFWNVNWAGGGVREKKMGERDKTEEVPWQKSDDKVPCEPYQEFKFILKDDKQVVKGLCEVILALVGRMGWRVSECFAEKQVLEREVESGWLKVIK